MQDDANTGPNTVELTADIVSSYAAHNRLGRADLPGLISTIHSALHRLDAGTAVEKAPEPKAPAVSIRKSIGEDFLICLEDGKKFKSLKRHLRTAYNLSPEDYRAKWKLPADYPMVAPAYSAARSQLARSIGLGQIRKMAAAEAVNEAVSEVVAVPESEATNGSGPEKTATANTPRKKAAAKPAKTAAPDSAAAPELAKRGRKSKAAA